MKAGGKNAKMQKKYIKIIEKKTATNKKINLNQYNNIKPTTTTVPNRCHRQACGGADCNLRQLPDYGPLTIFLMMQKN